MIFVLRSLLLVQWIQAPKTCEGVSLDLDFLITKFDIQLIGVVYTSIVRWLIHVERKRLQEVVGQKRYIGGSN